MYKLNLVTIVSIVAAVSLVVGMASPSLAFAQDNMSMVNMSSTGNMTGGGGNATSMAETESLPSAGETGLDPGEAGPCNPMCCHGDHPQC